jgi:hypothetical protein
MTAVEHGIESLVTDERTRIRDLPNELCRNQLCRRLAAGC